LIPKGLEIDEHGGTAWLGVIPFWMSGVARRPLPPLPGISRFPELNLRTYVRFEEKPGVWFLSLDAASRPAVWAARRWFHLPYHHARMTVARSGDTVDYRSLRTDGSSVGFAATYRPIGRTFAAPKGTIHHWFTERYCLYARSRRNELLRVDIHHLAWPLRAALAEVERNDLLGPHGLDAAGAAPHQQYAERLEVVVWSPERVRSSAD
jgi:uncharacterized protein YqjF (DUF2071 family)